MPKFFFGGVPVMVYPHYLRGKPLLVAPPALARVTRLRGTTSRHKESQAKNKRLQQSLSRKEKGSANRSKAQEVNSGDPRPLVCREVVPRSCAPYVTGPTTG